MKCLIVDDEKLAQDLLVEYVGKVESLTLGKVCNDAIEAMNFLQKHTVDLIFLDINMPELTGIDFLKTLPYSPKVILTTAYSEYALEAYEYGVVDYLLKPIAFSRFLKAVNRVVSHSANTVQYEKQTSSKAEEKVLSFKENGMPKKIGYQEIHYIKSFGNYLKVITPQKTYVILGTLSGIEEELDETFQRVHRSYVVNLNKVEAVASKYLKVAEEEIPVSAMFRLQLQERLGE